MPKKIPVRQCCACREHRPKNEMCRVVRTPDGGVALDTRGRMNGRGVYICRDPVCFARAVKSRAIARALETEIPPEALEALRLQIEREGGDG